jgi:hypothetical protein
LSMGFPLFRCIEMDRQLYEISLVVATAGCHTAHRETAR